MGISRGCFKIVDQVQDQGGTNRSTAGIYVIFRGLNGLSQHRDWALDAILKQLLIELPDICPIVKIYENLSLPTPFRACVLSLVFALDDI